MQAVSSIDVEANQFANHREGEIKFQRLLQGDPDSPNNFEWSLVRTGEDYVTPRHHHNFSQIHIVLEGTHEWAPDKLIPTGAVAYFPEGTFYGPQHGHGGLLLGLQYGEASGSGFMSYDRLAEGNKRLAEGSGRFEGGVYRYVDADGKARNKDGYEAIWEEMHGRPVEYPTAALRAGRRDAPRGVLVASDRRARHRAQAPRIVHRTLHDASDSCGTRAAAVHRIAGPALARAALRARRDAAVRRRRLRPVDRVHVRTRRRRVLEAVEATETYVDRAARSSEIRAPDLSSGSRAPGSPGEAADVAQEPRQRTVGWEQQILAEVDRPHHGVVVLQQLLAERERHGHRDLGLLALGVGCRRTFGVAANWKLREPPLGSGTAEEPMNTFIPAISPVSMIVFVP